jgi:hypothetical protein
VRAVQDAERRRPHVKEVSTDFALIECRKKKHAAFCFQLPKLEGLAEASPNRGATFETGCRLGAGPENLYVPQSAKFRFEFEKIDRTVAERAFLAGR